MPASTGLQANNNTLVERNCSCIELGPRNEVALSAISAVRVFVGQYPWSATRFTRHCGVQNPISPSLFFWASSTRPIFCLESRPIFFWTPQSVHRIWLTMASTRASYTMVPAVPAIMYSSGRCGLGSTHKISETSATQAKTAPPICAVRRRKKDLTRTLYSRAWTCASFG